MKRKIRVGCGKVFFKTIFPVREFFFLTGNVHDDY